MSTFVVKKFEYQPYSMEDAFTCGMVSWLRKLVDLYLEEEPTPYVGTLLMWTKIFIWRILRLCW